MSEEQAIETMDWTTKRKLLRDAGWTVAVHNDYRLAGKEMTFWLWTHPCGLFVKGEGSTDDEAIMQCVEAAKAAIRQTRATAKERIEEFEDITGKAYQAVGALADELGLFEDERFQKILDLLAYGKGGPPET